MRWLGEMHCTAFFKGVLLRTVVRVSDVGHFAEADVNISFERGVAGISSWEKHSHMD